MAACSSGSVISGKSIKPSMWRPLRFCQTVSYSAWTCSQVGCAGISVPNRRRHVSAVATACAHSELSGWGSQYELMLSLGPNDVQTDIPTDNFHKDELLRFNFPDPKGSRLASLTPVLAQV